MASFKTILEDVGKGLKVFFTDATKVAQAAEPIVDIALPGIAGLYNATVNEVVNAEAAAIAAGQQTGTGAQKLAAVVAAIEPTFNAYAVSIGLPAQPIGTIEAWVNAAVAGLNTIPAASVAAEPTPAP